MRNLDGYPLHCRKNIRKLTAMLNTDPETAYAMMILTAVLTDLSPDDDRIIEMILMDCNVEVRA